MTGFDQAQDNNQIKIISGIAARMRGALTAISSMNEYGKREAGMKIIACKTLLELKKEIPQEDYQFYGLDFDVLQAAFPPVEIAKKLTVPYFRIFECRVAGTPYYDAAAYIPNLALGGQCYLRMEPDNKFDRYAIEVLGHDGIKLGYVPRDMNREIGMYLECGAVCDVTIKKYSVGKEDDGTYARLSVTIEFICTEEGGADAAKNHRRTYGRADTDSHGNKYSCDDRSEYNYGAHNDDRS